MRTPRFLQRKLVRVLLVAAPIGALALALALTTRPKTLDAAVDGACAVGAAPTTYTSGTLNASTPDRDGVVWDDGYSALRINYQGGSFKSSALTSASNVFAACAGDFDEDGWEDFVGFKSDSSFMRFFKNQTYENPAPDWNDANQLRTPKFVPTTLTADGATMAGGSSNAAMACGDFNNDGHQDFVYARYTSPNKYAHIFLGKGNGTFQTPYNMETSTTRNPNIGWTATGLVAVDYNNDGWLDLIAGEPSATLSQGGEVHVFLNDKSSTAPHLKRTVALVTNAGMGDAGATTIVFDDFNNDGVKDLVAAGVASNVMKFYPGLLGGGVGTGVAIAYQAGMKGASTMLSADYSLDGIPDLIFAQDGAYTGNTAVGGYAYYYKAGTGANPFSAGMTANLTPSPKPPDYDIGFNIDYDHDPQHTKDFLSADGNGTSYYYLFANRVTPVFVDCGTVASDVIDLGSIEDTETTITEVVIDPSVITNGGTVTWEASNNNGTTWQPGAPCAGDPTKICISFGSAVGNSIRWRARMCSDSTKTKSPRISGIGLKFSYVTSTNHYRSGPIARDGIVYIGAFREPGSAGRFFAMDDETGTPLWDAADLLESRSTSSRHVYTVSVDNTRLDFSKGQSGTSTFQATVLAANTSTADLIVDWFFSPRFGLYKDQKFGAIENSTAALLTPPQVPYWFINTGTSTATRDKLNEFVAANAERPQLVFVNSRDGALHAFYTNPKSSTDPDNGKEMWAFIPYDVAQRINADRIAGTSTAYPDGSPTLANVLRRMPDGTDAWRTILISGEGNGGRGVYALDVTNTVDKNTGTVTGPTPLWHYSDANMGRTYSKPTVARVMIADEERWLAIFASGPGLSVDVGDTAYAIDISTGETVWTFDIGDTNAYIATDVTVSETDDEDEPGEPKVDGYIDRVFFGDSKGRIWKLDPAVVGAGVTVGSTVDVGLPHNALFSTKRTPGLRALGEDRAIAGTLATAPDATGRLVLYFGTGGTEETPSGVQNGFYAVYADTGEIRSALEVSPGTKFYGGVAYNDGQLIFSTGKDLSGAGLCAASAGEIVAIDANTFAQDFIIPTGSKIVAPVFAQNGEIYTVTLKGDLVASAFTGSNGSGGGGSGTGTGGTPGSGTGAGTATTPFKVLGWRQVP